MKKRVYGAVLSVMVMIGSVMSVGCGKTEEQKPAEVTEVTETSENEVDTEEEAEDAETTELTKEERNALLPAGEEIDPGDDEIHDFGADIETTTTVSAMYKTPMTVSAMYNYLMAAAEYEGISVGIENMTKGEFVEWLAKVWTPEINYEFCEKMEIDSDEAFAGLKMYGYDDGWSRELHDEMVSKGKWFEYTFFENWREEHPGEYTELEK